MCLMCRFWVSSNGIYFLSIEKSKRFSLTPSLLFFSITVVQASCGSAVSHISITKKRGVLIGVLGLRRA